jgi:hypothetical protein
MSVNWLATVILPVILIVIIVIIFIVRDYEVFAVPRFKLQNYLPGGNESLEAASVIKQETVLVNVLSMVDHFI